MSFQHYTFRTLPPEYKELKLWREIDVEALQDEDKRRFLRLKTGIETYVRSGKLSVASQEANCSESMLIKQLNRCTAVAGDGRIYGWAGLVKGLRIKNYRRIASLPSVRTGATRGFSGCFAKFLEEHEEIRKELDAQILKTGRNKPAQEARISKKGLTRKFRDLCIQFGIRENEYPLNTTSRGRRSISRYADWLITQKPSKGTKARFGTDAQRHLAVGTGKPGIAIAWAPYDVAGLDAHEIHCIGCVIVNGPAGPQRVAIERLWVIFIVDEISRAILGYSVGIRTEVSSATVEEALISATSEWKPRSLSIPGLEYREGGGLPSGLIPELAGCFPAILKVDNASQHYAKRIAEDARKRLGCAVTWGSIGHWEHNAVIERLFKTLEIYGFQRLPSTTGSNVTDSLKDEAVVKALELGVTWEGLLDLMDVLVASYNATPNRGLGGQFPLQVLANHLRLASPLFFPRNLPPPTVGQPDLGITVETRFVRGNQLYGRRPYIEIDRVRYTSPVLAQSFGLVGKQLRVHIRESNMCTVNAFFESGEELGVLAAQGGWGKTSHTREMRKQIWALFDAGEFAVVRGEDPVEKFLQVLASRAYQNALDRPKSISHAGTRLANAANVSGLPIPPASPSDSKNTDLAEGDKLPGPIPSSIKGPTWKSVT